ncbi:glutathione S-transferase [Saccharata proteae CBS 121410]|uniref:Glutathione S-transferase n=1 Tax=Saccharata proteae CBS 121410 TaxID=1314787 RepID=A0A9P4HTV8_9PEZI|nr:glutathione S-transferase [Saccharata proteae CBS 121410]
MSSAPNDIVLFHYPFSPYARRVIWYLQLRGIAYAQCASLSTSLRIQPPVLPRDDLNALGVAYRRIPVLTIGRHVYCDTRLILRKLEHRFPNGALGASGCDHKAIQRLLERWTVDAGIFARAASLIPPNMPALQDPKFSKDREQFTGRSWNKEELERGRPESVVHIRDAFELLESTLLADGRDWILKSAKPTLADIEAIWPFDWLVEMKGALPSSVISEVQFPKVYSWIRRFREALKAAKASGPKTITFKGPEAVRFVAGADDLAESTGRVDESDPLGLRRDDVVEVWPIDSGFSHRDRGRLVSLTPDEVVLASKTPTGDGEVHVHFPRWGFRVAKAGGRTKL